MMFPFLSNMLLGREGFQGYILVGKLVRNMWIDIPGMNIEDLGLNDVEKYMDMSRDYGIHGERRKRFN